MNAGRRPHARPEMTAILGINAFHADSAACLVIDGQLVGAVAEERLGERLKHSPRFPSNAIRRLLEDAGLRLADVTHVAIARDATANYAAKARYVLARPARSARAVVEHLRRNRKTQGLQQRLAEICGEDASSARFQVVHVEHHLAHIASAYYLSPFDGVTAALSYDASGRLREPHGRAVRGVADRGPRPGPPAPQPGLLLHGPLPAHRLRGVRRGVQGHGAGALWRGCPSRGDGRPREGERQRLVLPRHGRVRDARGRGERRADSRRAHRHGPALRRQAPGSPGARPPAGRAPGAAPQGHRALLPGALRGGGGPLPAPLHGLVPTDRLAMAGGCSLNGVANARILRDTPFRQVYLQPAASDDGTCVGAAFHCWHSVLGRSERFHMAHAFWGPGYSDERLRQVAEGAGFDSLRGAGRPTAAEGRRPPGPGPGDRVVSGAQRVGSKGARESLHPREPDAAPHEGPHQRQDQAARVVPALRAFGAAGAGRDLLRAGRPEPVHDARGQDQARVAREASRRHPRGRDGAAPVRLAGARTRSTTV